MNATYKYEPHSNAENIFASIEFSSAALARLSQTVKHHKRRHYSHKSSRDKHGTLKWNTFRHAINRENKRCKRQKLDKAHKLQLIVELIEYEHPEQYESEDIYIPPWVLEGYYEFEFTPKTWRNEIERRFEYLNPKPLYNPDTDYAEALDFYLDDYACLGLDCFEDYDDIGYDIVP